MAAANVDIHVRAIDKATPDLRRITREMQGMQKSTTSFASSFQGSFLGATAGLVSFQAAVTSTQTALRSTIGAAIDFESSFAGIRKTVDATETEFKALEQANRNLAKNLPVSVNEINRIGETAGALGITGVKNIEKFEKTVATLAVTTNLASDEAASALGKIRTALDIPVDDLENLSSAIVDLGNKGASTETEIVDFLSRIAGAGKLIGILPAQLAGISSAFASLGLEAEAGGSAIQRVFLAMASAAAQGGDELKIFAASLGTTTEGFREALANNPTETFIQFVEALGLAGDEAIRVLDALGLADVRLERSFLTAAGAGGELRRQVAVGTQAYKENTAAAIELEKRTATTASQFQLLKNQLNDIGIALGQSILPELNAVLTGMNQLIGPTKEATIAVNEFKNSVREAAGPFDDLLILLSAVGNPLNLLSVSFKAVEAAMVPVINVALQVGTAIVNLYGGILNAGAELLGGWDNLWSKITSIISTAKDTIVSVAQLIADAIASVGGFIDSFINKANGFTGKISGLLSKAGINIPSNLPTLGLTAPQIGGGGGTNEPSLAEIAFLMNGIEKGVGAVGDAAAGAKPDISGLSSVLDGLDATAGAATHQLTALEAVMDGVITRTEAMILGLTDAQVIALELAAAENEVANEEFRRRIELKALAQAYAGLTGAEVQMRLGLEAIADHLRDTGQSIEQFILDTSATMLQGFQSAFDAIFNKPTKEDSQLQLQLLEAQRRKLLAPNASEAQRKAFDAEIDRLQNLIAIRRNADEITKTRAEIADNTALTDQAQATAAELYIAAIDDASAEVTKNTGIVFLQTLAQIGLKDQTLSLTSAFANLNDSVTNATPALSMADALKALAALPDHGQSLLPSYASGTNSVPYDMIAKIHKGERIIPAGMAGESGQPINVTSYITIEGDATERTVEMIKRAVRDEAETAIRRASFRGSYVTSGAYTPS